MKNIIVKPLTHKGDNQFGLFFPYDDELIALARAAGCVFSRANRCWYITDNKENLKKLFTTFKGKAWLDITALKADKLGPKLKQLPVPVMLPEARQKELERFVDWLRHRHYSEQTISVYLSCVHVYFQHNPEKDPKLIDRDDFIAFTKEHIIARGLSFSYQNQFVNALKLFLKQVHGILVNTDFLERPRTEEKLPNVLSKEEVQLILKHTANLKHKLMLSIAYGCGLRAGEVLALQAAHIDRERKCVHIHLAKGFKDRVVPLPGVILPLLNNYLAAYRHSHYLFEGEKPGSQYSARSLQQIIKKSVALAGINKPVTMHWLRHSFATHLLEAGVDVRYIQVILGHKQLKTTEIYTHVSTHQLNKIISPIDGFSL